MINYIFSDLSFSYYQRNPIGNATYLGNWSQYLSKNIYDIFESYDWAVKPTRDYNKLKDIIDFDDPKNKPFLDLSHFSKFKSTDNCQWKIEDYKSITDDLLLSQHIKKYLKVFKIWVTQIPAGCCIPQHIDTVDVFIKDYEISEEDISSIKRFIILPEDTKPWHHLWYGNTVISSGKLGDAWSFNFWEPHGGSNLGSKNKYTIQVMGI